MVRSVLCRLLVYITGQLSLDIPGRKITWQGSQVSRQLVGVIHPVCLHRCVKLAHTVVTPLTVGPEDIKQQQGCLKLWQRLDAIYRMSSLGFPSLVCITAPLKNIYPAFGKEQLSV